MRLQRLTPGNNSIVQNKVNEYYGIGKIKVDLTGSGSDRLVRAKDVRINEYLNGDD